MNDSLNTKSGEILSYAAAIEELHEIATVAIAYLKDIIYLNHMQDLKTLDSVIWEAKEILESYKIFVDIGED